MWKIICGMKVSFQSFGDGDTPENTIYFSRVLSYLNGIEEVSFGFFPNYILLIPFDILF